MTGLHSGEAYGDRSAEEAGLFNRPSELLQFSQIGTGLLELLIKELLGLIGYLVKTHRADGEGEEVGLQCSRAIGPDPQTSP